MGSTIAVIVRDDPRTSHRPVEALRITLGLAAGDHCLTVVLLGKASLLITEDTDDIVDGDVLETYLPSFKKLAVPFVVTAVDPDMTFQPGLSIRTQNAEAVKYLIGTAEHTLVF
jgi:hypothetical protein